MGSYNHHGAAVIITNKNRDSFYLQKKDSNYWIPEYRGAYCFFGGKIEKGEKEIEGLKRELEEELHPDVSNLISKNLVKVFDDYFTSILGEKCKFSVYQRILSDKQLTDISNYEVKEGEGGFLIKRSDLEKIDFFYDLKKAFKKYLAL